MEEKQLPALQVDIVRKEIVQAGHNGMTLQQAAHLLNVSYGDLLTLFNEYPDLQSAWHQATAEQASRYLQVIKDKADSEDKGALQAAMYLHKHFTQLQNNTAVQFNIHTGMPVDAGPQIVQLLPVETLKAIAMDAELVKD